MSLLERAVLTLPTPVIPIPSPLSDHTYHTASYHIQKKPFYWCFITVFKTFSLFWMGTQKVNTIFSAATVVMVSWWPWLCFSWLLNFLLIFRDLSLQHSRYEWHGIGPWRRGRKGEGICCQNYPSSLLLPILVGTWALVHHLLQLQSSHQDFLLHNLLGWEKGFHWLPPLNWEHSKQSRAWGFEIAKDILFRTGITPW